MRCVAAIAKSSTGFFGQLQRPISPMVRLRDSEVGWHPQGTRTMSIESALREKLMVGLEPVRLDVINESEMHAGHRSSPGTGESHFRVLIVSDKFTGQSRVARHRMVNQLIAEELAGGLHALALATYAPGEKI
jgi:BolA protein